MFLQPDIKYSLTLTAARAIVTHIDELVDLVLDDLCRVCLLLYYM